MTVLEAGDAVGGRVRTDEIDGFRCDRGFQVLNPAYPTLRRWTDLSALGLQSFGVGARVTTQSDASVLAHPLRHPELLLSTVRSEHLQVSDVLALVRWIGPALLSEAAASRPSRDRALRASFDAAGFTGPLRRNLMDTFLAGVMVDSSGEKSADYARMLVRWFALGAPGLPEKGMQALPEQMASNLAEPVRLRSPARELHETADGVTVTTDGAALRARLAVVAVGPEHVADLTALPAPVTHGLTTWWFRAPEPPGGGTFLTVDASGPGGGPAGPVWNTAVVSEAAPSYAPRGEHLVQATTLLDQPTGLADEAAVRRDLERIYRTSARRWELLTHHVVPHTLPGQPPPLRRHREQRINDRTLIAGDHLDQGSIEGAMASGDRAARTASSLLAGVRRG